MKSCFSIKNSRTNHFRHLAWPMKNKLMPHYYWLALMKKMLHYSVWWSTVILTLGWTGILLFWKLHITWFTYWPTRPYIASGLSIFHVKSFRSRCPKLFWSKYISRLISKRCWYFNLLAYSSNFGDHLFWSEKGALLFSFDEDSKIPLYGVSAYSSGLASHYAIF